MLKHPMKQEEKLENLIQEARKQIPFYTKEWDPFRSSDPAEILLKNLSSFSLLQQEHMERLPENVQEKIFKMAGFQIESGKSARVLVEAENVEQPVQITSGQRFQVGNLSFETNKDFTIRGNRLTGIFTKWEDAYTDYSFILDEDYPIGGTVFTKKPQKGMELYLVMDGMTDAGEDLIFYVHIADEYHRNAFEGKSSFAQIQWQIYTKRGFIDIRCKDGTGSFQTSGELTFHIPKEEAVIFRELPVKGYVLKGILNRADYDFFPKIKRINGFLFEVWQKETKAVCYTYSGKNRVIDLYRNISEKGFLQVFCKENQEEGYYLYEESNASKKDGRYYGLEKLPDGRLRIVFNEEVFGYAPGNFANAVKVVFYNDEMMRNAELGRIYGYDNQKLILPAKHIVKESFSIIAEKIDENGVRGYYFIRPFSKKREEFYYILKENEGIIEIEDASDFIDCRLFLGSCAVSDGAAGNIREGCRFSPVGYETKITFRNPAAGQGGCYTERLENMKERLKADLKKTYTAVEAADYEELVRETPELCIDKVRAVKDKVKNQVAITVKPVSTQPFPKLSEIYETAIRKHLEKARLLTVNIKLQQPVYVPVNVSGIIYVKSHYGGARKQIEEVIRWQVDYVNSEHNFGDKFYFDTLFQQLESLDCVKYIYDLSVSLSSRSHALQKGFDIQPEENCLLYPGEFHIELRNAE